MKLIIKRIVITEENKEPERKLSLTKESFDVLGRSRKTRFVLTEAEVEQLQEYLESGKFESRIASSFEAELDRLRKHNKP